MKECVRLLVIEADSHSHQCSTIGLDNDPRDLQAIDLADDDPVFDNDLAAGGGERRGMRHRRVWWVHQGGQLRRRHWDQVSLGGLPQRRHRLESARHHREHGVGLVHHNVELGSIYAGAPSQSRGKGRRLIGDQVDECPMPVENCDSRAERFSVGSDVWEGASNERLELDLRQAGKLIGAKTHVDASRTRCPNAVLLVG